MAAVDAKAINIYMSVTGPFASQMARNGAAVQTFGAQANAGMAQAQTGAARFGATASKIATVGAVAIALGLALSVKAAITFESSFAGIKKTVDTTDAGFRRLAEGIRGMAREIPIGVNELNRIAELGGQLGVEAPDLLEFTETIALIGITTTLSTDLAATGFARLDNIMGLNQESFSEMGSSIVDLGNNFAATEDEILNFALRVAPIGATIGLTTDEVLAIATAFTSVGVRAERGGTAIQKTFINMAEAAQNGGVELEIFARVAGVTADQFKKMVESDPAAAFEAFVTGLARVRAEGGNVFQTLDNLHLGNTRVVQSLLAMSNAEGVLADALMLSDEAWQDNTALTEEAEKRFETTASQLKVLKNNIIDAGIAIGTELLPFVGDLAGGFKAILDWIVGLPKGVKIAVAAIGALVAVLGLMVAHPIIFGLLLVAGAIALIGKNARESAARQQVLVDNLDFGTSNKQDLTTLIGADPLRDLLKSGFTPDDIQKAIFGSEAEFQAFLDLDAAEQRILGSGGRGYYAQEFDFRNLEAAGPRQSKGAAEVAKRRRELAELREEESRNQAQRNKAARFGEFGTGPSRADIINESGRATVRAIQDARQGIAADGSALIFVPADVEDQIDDIKDAIGDYRDVFSEAFSDIDSEIKGHIDLLYEFGDDLDFVWNDIVASTNRQADALIAFEQFFLDNDISPTVEMWLRNAAPSPAGMEAFLKTFEIDPETAWAGIDELETISVEKLDKLVETIFARRYEDLELLAGRDLLTAISEIVDDVTEDGKFDVVQAWMGVMLETQKRLPPDQFKGVMDMLRLALADPAFKEAMGFTTQQIYDLIEALNLIPSNVSTEVEVTFTGKPGDADNFNYNNPPPTFTGEPSAHGGFAFAGKPYLIGELGPELFVPFNSGTIIPNDELGGGKEVVYNLNVYGSEDTGLDARTILLTAQTIGAF